MAVDAERARAAVLELLHAIGEDPARPGLAETPSRVAEAAAELFAGVGADPGEALGDPVPVGERSGELVVATDLAFRSVCEHHLLPFTGRASVAYVPADAVVGLGAFPRLIQSAAARPQVQERLGEEIAAAIEARLGATGVLVVLDAAHGCVRLRGPRQEASRAVTVASRGVLAEPARRAEVFALLAASGATAGGDGDA